MSNPYYNRWRQQLSELNPMCKLTVHHSPHTLCPSCQNCLCQHACCCFLKGFFSEGCTWLPPQCLDQDQPCYNKPYLAATCVSLVQQTGHHSTSSVQQTGKHPTPGRCWGSYTISRTSYAQLPALNNYWDSGDTHCQSGDGSQHYIATVWSMQCPIETAERSDHQWWLW